MLWPKVLLQIELEAGLTRFVQLILGLRNSCPFCSWPHPKIELKYIDPKTSLYVGKPMFLCQFQNVSLALGFLVCENVGSTFHFHSNGYVWLPFSIRLYPSLICFKVSLFSWRVLQVFCFQWRNYEAIFCSISILKVGPITVTKAKSEVYDFS